MNTRSMRRNIRQKFVVSFVAIVQVVAMLFPGVAAAFSYPSPTEIMAQAESRYHLNLGSIQNFGESMNTSANKETAPQVNVLFTPTDPREGQEVVAEAVPLYFSTANEDLYYTWYLKRDGCDIKSGDLTDQDKTCDLDNDDEITVNDWKIEAMRYIVQNGFTPESYTIYDVNKEERSDGFNAPIGGLKRSGNAHCYIHDFQKGKDYEIISNALESKQGALPVSSCAQLFPEYKGANMDISFGDENGDGKDEVQHVNFDDADEVGDGKFSLEEEVFWGSDPKDPSTAQNGKKDEANVVGLGQNRLKWDYWKGDKLGVAVEGASMLSTKYGDASMKIMWALPKNACPLDLSGATASPVTTGSVFPSWIEENYSVLKKYTVSSSKINLQEGGSDKQVSVSLQASPDAGKVVQIKASFKNGGVASFTTPATLTFDETNWNDAQSVSIEALTDANTIDETETLIFDVRTARADRDTAFDSLKRQEVSIVVIDGDQDVASNEDGNNVIQAEFEGDAQITYDDSELNEIDEGGKKFGVLGTPISLRTWGLNGDTDIPTIQIDLNECLEGNLVSPTDGNQAGNLEVSLSSTPENPLVDVYNDADDHDRRGSKVSVQSMLTNSATQSSRLRYDWNVSMSKSGEVASDAGWTRVTDSLKLAGMLGQTNGNSLSSIDINLNVPKSGDPESRNDVGDDADMMDYDMLKTYLKEGVGYMRINLTVSENFEKGTQRIGRAQIILKMVLADKYIKAYSASAEESPANSGQYRFTMDGIEPLCDRGLDLAICPVVRGQVIGLFFDTDDLEYEKNGESIQPDITWTLNNNPLVCTPNVSSDIECTMQNSSRNFFPVTGNPGEIYTVSAIANNPVSGKSITMSRVFRVVKPSVSISSTDETKVWRKFLGQFVGLDNSRVDNYSNTELEAAPKKFRLKGEFFPESLKENAAVAWFVDDGLAEPEDDGSVLVNASKDTPGAVHTVALRGGYTPDSAVRRALLQAWNISPVDIDSVGLSSSVNIDIVAIEGEGEDGELAMEQTKKFFAGLISYVPSSVLFLFRLFLTMAVTFFLVALVFSLTPSNATSRRKTFH